MDIKKTISEQYSLTKKTEFYLDCYLLSKGKYLIFWNEKIKKNSIKDILVKLEKETNNSKFSKHRTLIVLGYTEEFFKREDLIYYNNKNIFVTFYLFNEKHHRVFMNDSHIFTLRYNYKKYIRKLNKIIKEPFEEKVDWRLRYYDGYLNGYEFKKETFVSTERNDHEHCEFCWITITDLDTGVEHFEEGYVTLNESTKQTNWVCEKCFNDFKNELYFKELK